MILELKNIEYQYRQSKWRLGPINLSLGRGQMTAIIGPNGSGKSTLIKITAGITKPISGQVLLAGSNIFKLSRKKIALTLGYLPQCSSGFYNYRVYDIVAMGRFAHLKGLGFLDTADHDHILAAMSLTETLQYRDRHFNQLSGGEKQRVLLASVLAQQPQVLLLDEPTTNLDLHHQIAFFKLLKKLTVDGLSILVITHQLNLASAFSSSVILLGSGRVYKSGSVEDVITSSVLGCLYPDNLFISRHPLSGKPVILPQVDIADRSIYD